MSGLWRSYPAARKRGCKATQADVLLSMLREARAQGRPLTLPEIMAAGIAQHGARFNELRSRGFIITNKLERSSEGIVHSRYTLTFDPERDAKEDSCA